MWVSALSVSFISWVMAFYLVGEIIYINNHNYDRNTHVDQLNTFRKHQSDTYAVFYILMAVVSVLTSILLNRMMSKHFGESLQKERKVFAWMFSIFTATYVLYAIFLCAEG